MSLFRTAARAHVATRVIGSTHRRQQRRWAAQEAAATQPASPQPAASPGTPGAATTMLDQLSQLGKLREAGVLTDEEFETQKLRILSSGHI